MVCGPNGNDNIIIIMRLWTEIETVQKEIAIVNNGASEICNNCLSRQANKNTENKKKQCHKFSSHSKRQKTENAILFMSIQRI